MRGNERFSAGHFYTPQLVIVRFYEVRGGGEVHDNDQRKKKCPNHSSHSDLSPIPTKIDHLNLKGVSSVIRIGSQNGMEEGGTPPSFSDDFFSFFIPSADFSNFVF